MGISQLGVLGKHCLTGKEKTFIKEYKKKKKRLKNNLDLTHLLELYKKEGYCKHLDAKAI